MNKPLNENKWFGLYQPQLLAFINTDEGRDTLLLPRDMPTIVEISKSHVKYLIAPGEYISDFRIGSKYGNLARMRWEAVERGLDYMSSSIYQRRLRVGNKWLPVVAGAGTTTEHPDADTETTTVDGYARAPESSQTWSTIRDASGNASNDNGTSLFVFLGYGIDGGSNQWNRNYRVIMGFDTSAIGTDTISAAVLSTVGLSGSVVDQHSGSVSMCEGASASNTAIADGDYQTNKGKNLVASTAALSGLTANGSAYTDFTLSSGGRAYITTDGVTKFSSQIEADRANSEPSGMSAGTEKISRVDWASADTSSESKDPKLVVTHAADHIPTARFFY